MEELKIDITCNPLSHLCRVNEKVEFFITANRAEEMEAVVTIDGESVLEKRTVTPPCTLTASLPFPGFIRCTVTAGDVKKECGVGVDPDQIQPLKQEPADFDAFWENAFKELNKIDPDFRMTPCGKEKNHMVYRLDCANVNGLRFYAMLALPENKEKKAPLLVLFGGGEAYLSEAAFRSTVPGERSAPLMQDCAVLFFHLPPYPPVGMGEDPKERHQKFLDEIGLKRYVYYGLDDPTKFYAYPAILGSIRLLDHVVAMPEINKDAIIYRGASHGGGFGLYYTCFSKHIKAAFCGVPNFGDIAGVLAGRHPTDSNAPQFRENIGTRQYFDAAFCARRITCPIFIGVGFTDNACSPSSVYAIYNNLAGPKFMFNKIANGHGDCPPEYAPMIDAWLEGHLKQCLGEEKK